MCLHGNQAQLHLLVSGGHNEFEKAEILRIMRRQNVNIMEHPGINANLSFFLNPNKETVCQQG